jgi:hypothetical protein
VAATPGCSLAAMVVLSGQKSCSCERVLQQTIVPPTLVPWVRGRYLSRAAALVVTLWGRGVVHAPSSHSKEIGYNNQSASGGTTRATRGNGDILGSARVGTKRHVRK